MTTREFRPFSCRGFWMSRPFVIDLICEDSAHESLLRPLLVRMAEERQLVPRVRVMSARGGAPRVNATVQLWAHSVASNNRSRPDALVIGIDSNCRGRGAVEPEVRGWVGDQWAELLILACPNAHVERWYLADQAAFTRVVGGGQVSVPDKCERDLYKRILREAVEAAGQLAPSGGVEFGPELATAIDFYRLGKNDPAFRAFHDACASLLNRAKEQRAGQ